MTSCQLRDQRGDGAGSTCKEALTVKRSKEEILAEVAEQERIIKEVVAGKEVLCKVCKLPLAYYPPGSGRHPGIYCSTGCTEMRMTFGPKQ